MSKNKSEIEDREDEDAVSRFHFNYCVVSIFLRDHFFHSCQRAKITRGGVYGKPQHIIDLNQTRTVTFGALWPFFRVREVTPDKSSTNVIEGLLNLLPKVHFGRIILQEDNRSKGFERMRSRNCFFFRSGQVTKRTACGVNRQVKMKPYCFLILSFSSLT